MSEEYDPLMQPVEPNNPDDDVPFHLPMTADDPESPEVEGTWKDAASDPHSMPTMPIPLEPGFPDPKKTLPGSGGLDPNPDFTSPDAGHTMRHEPVRPNQTQSNPAPLPYDSSNTAHQPFQRPQQPQYQYMPPAPPAPAAQAQPQANLPRRQQAKRKGCLGCSPGCLGIIIGFIAIFCGGMTLLTAGVGLWGFNRVEQLANERISGVDSYKNFQSTFYYDRGGQLLYESFGEGRRTSVKYADFPKSLIDATVAIEDDNFFTNPGIDVPATLRALLQYVGIARGSSGGSTITQQVVRNVLFDYKYRSERSIQRKVEEIVLALALTQRKSKETILELYLNEIYYGNLAYGAEAAAQTLFNKHVGELNLGEAALLAGLPQAPAELDPLSFDPKVQDSVYSRQRQVLDRMVLKKYITDDQRNEALRQGLTFVTPSVSLRAPHFTLYAKTQLERLMGDLGYSPEEITNGGLKVYTTLDLSINDLAQAAARDQVAKLAANRVSNASVLVLKPVTGEILAMVGSVDYNNDNIDGRVNVSISPRQPGSTMKPFNYSAAIEAGMTPGDVIWDTPTTIGIPGQPAYTPRNYDSAFHGPVIMRYALANSYNIPAVQTLRRYGVQNLLSLMQRFGVKSLGDDASKYGLSLTLGGGEITLLELTSAYSVFADEGSLVPTTAILCVLDRDNKIIYQYENGCTTGEPNDKTVSISVTPKPILDPRIAFLMSDILSDNVARSTAMGSNSPLNTGNLRASVKTGTTNDFKDNWTVGFTRNVAVGVWVGNSRGEAMVNTSGLTGAAPIWNSVITSIYANQKMLDQFASNGQLLPNQMQAPQGMSVREICDVRRLKDPAADCPRVREWFLDSPAGLLDENGNMNFPPAQPAQQQPAVSSGPQLRQVSPGVYQVLAYRLNPGVAASIQFTSAGRLPPPAPIYCQVPVELAGSAAGAQEQLFIAPPPDPDDAVNAENYARTNGLAFLPTVACSPELLQGGGAGGPIVTTAVITSPSPGQVLKDVTTIVGTVQFSPDQGKFYKVEVVGGQFNDWVTIGPVHTDNVVNGKLDDLNVPGLQPGNYKVRLVIVDNTGGFLQPPYEVPFVVTR